MMVTKCAPFWLSRTLTQFGRKGDERFLQLELSSWRCQRKFTPLRHMRLPRCA
jgi:hypothetical protein